MYLVQSFLYYFIKKVLIDLKNVKNLVLLEKIEPRIRRIYQSPEYNRFDERKKHGIKTFLDTFDGKTMGPQ